MTGLRTVGLCLVLIFFVSLSVDISFGEEPAPRDFSLKEFNSQENKSFSDILITKANIMIVTETTCVSCIKEIKSMEWLRAKYRGDLSVTTVFVDRQGWSRVRKYLDYYKFDLDMFLVDAGGVIPLRFNANYIPTLILFNQAGEEVFRKKGFAEGEESLISAKIDELLSEPRVRRRVSTSAPVTTTRAPAPAEKKTTGCASTG